MGFLMMSLAAWPDSAALAPDAVDFFESRIRPVLAQDCYECHTTNGKKKGGLALDWRDAIAAGGESGKVVDLTNPTASVLLQAIRHDSKELAMPKARAKLDAQVIADFEKWVRMGAPDPRTAPPSDAQIAADTDWNAVMKRRASWWSFQPIKKPDLNAFPASGAGGGHPVDRLVRAKLAAFHLTPAPRADRYTLLRRLSFALRGLPPSPGEIEAFVADPSNDAFENKVDAYLASPRFGERWARYWMDWTRYADSHGSEGDPMIPYAWRYRDYLIRALNADVPYDQMVREHLAGDLLERPRLNPALGLNESALGLGHLRMVFHGFAPTDPLDEQVRFTDDQIGTVSKAFLGLTVSCARCHNHKFDPISQKDYYGWYGVFVSCPPAAIAVDAPEPPGAPLRAELHARANAARDALVKAWLSLTNSVAAQLSTPSPAMLQAIEQAKEPCSILHPFHVLRHPDAQHDIAKVLAAWRTANQGHLVFAPTDVAKRWDLTSPVDFAKWRHDGPGVASLTHSGVFTLAPEGDTVLTGIYPSGVYTHGDSSKDRGLLLSPHFQLDEKYDLWVRVRGDRGAVLRYVMQNYPRDGTVFPVERLSGNQWRWVKFGMEYWQGDRTHLEISTAADQPVLADVNSVRSSFGIREVVLTKSGSPGPAESYEFAEPILRALGDSEPTNTAQLADAYGSASLEAIRAWSNGADVPNRLTDNQALFLDQLVKVGLLPNQVKALPEVAGALDEWRKIEAKIRVPIRAQGLVETDPYDQPLFVRGDHKHPADPVPRQFLDAIDNRPFGHGTSGRLELAEAILAPGNPLTSRVIVNRIWHHMFGRGIVATTDNFGRLGSEPTNPELLDYLAAWFMEHGYSIKGLIRFIANSETWQQASEPSAAATKTDPANLYLSHFSVRRTEAEAIRDTLLSVAGTLQESEMYGPPVLGQSPRRSVYLRVKRNELDPFMTAFDAPAPASTKGVRDVTNVPGQSLALLNDPSVMELATHWADAIVARPDLHTNEERIRAMFLQAFSRRATDEETKQATQFLDWSRDQQNQTAAELRGLEQNLTEHRQRIAELSDLAMIRVQATRSNAMAKPSVSPLAPLAEWSFDHDSQDHVGILHAKLINQAKLEGGSLVVDGHGSYASTIPLSQSIKAKTLEAWVQLSNLDQQGGGVISIQDLGGNVFDAIVFGERESRRWMAGSEGYVRTQSFDGTAEDEALARPVHVVITYTEDGTVTGYRNGKPYGKPYKSNGPHIFEAGHAQILFGNRHGEPTGNKSLAGQIFKARIYDRALTPQEIEASSAGDLNYVSTVDRLAAMSEAERAEFTRRETDAVECEHQLAEAKRTRGLPTEWASLGHALFNLKEFIYIR